jgi:hypothetical protein
MLKTIGMILAIVGVAMLALAGWLLQRELSFQSKAATAPGRVVEFAISTSSDGTVMAAPIVEFHAQDGATITFTDSVSSPNGSETIYFTNSRASTSGTTHPITSKAKPSTYSLTRRIRRSTG